jgi:hypothetical protein
MGRHATVGSASAIVSQRTSRCRTANLGSHSRFDLLLDAALIAADELDCDEY